MELRLLNTFVAVARFNSFTQAAEHLSYAQSSVTSQVQALESELGVRLFERLGKSISMTPEGEKLLPFAKQVLKLCDDARIAVAPAGALKGALVIGAPESLCAVRLVPLFTEFHNRYPEVELSLQFGGCTEFEDLLGGNQIDIAFFLERKLNPPSLESVLEWPEPIALLAAPGHPLVRTAGIEPHDVQDILLILAETGCSYRTRFLQMLSDAGVTPKSTMESSSVQVMKQLAMSGLGITLLPRVAAIGELAEGKLVELTWAGPPFEMMMTQVMYHKDKWISPAMRAFIDLAGEMLLPVETLH